jgi:hypothetical protein
VYDQRLYDSRRPPAARLIFRFRDLPATTHMEVFRAALTRGRRGCKLTYTVEEIPNARAGAKTLTRLCLRLFGRADSWHEACSKSQWARFFTDGPLISTVARAGSAGQG